MAANTTTKLIMMLLLIFICVDQALASSGCMTTGNTNECFDSSIAAEYYSRKMLLGLVDRVKASRLANKGSDDIDSERIFKGTELRAVPSGPDPMHHNGHIPRQPVN